MATRLYIVSSKECLWSRCRLELGIYFLPVSHLLYQRTNKFLVLTNYQNMFDIWIGKMDVVWFLIGEFPIQWTNCSVCSLERRRNNRGKSWGGAGNFWVGIPGAELEQGWEFWVGITGAELGQVWGFCIVLQGHIDGADGKCQGSEW